MHHSKNVKLPLTSTIDSPRIKGAILKVNSKTHTEQVHKTKPSLDMDLPSEFQHKAPISSTTPSSEIDSHSEFCGNKNMEISLYEADINTNSASKLPDSNFVMPFYDPKVLAVEDVALQHHASIADTMSQGNSESYSNLSVTSSDVNDCGSKYKGTSSESVGQHELYTGCEEETKTSYKIKSEEERDSDTICDSKDIWILEEDNQEIRASEKPKSTSSEESDIHKQLSEAEVSISSETEDIAEENENVTELRSAQKRFSGDQDATPHGRICSATQDYRSKLQSPTTGGETISETKVKTDKDLGEAESYKPIPAIRTILCRTHSAEERLSNRTLPRSNRYSLQPPLTGTLPVPTPRKKRRAADVDKSMDDFTKLLNDVFCLGDNRNSYGEDKEEGNRSSTGIQADRLQEKKLPLENLDWAEALLPQGDNTIRRTRKLSPAIRKKDIMKPSDFRHVSHIDVKGYVRIKKEDPLEVIKNSKEEEKRRRHVSKAKPKLPRTRLTKQDIGRPESFVHVEHFK